MDGVRAVAVLTVLAYHTSAGLPGGFLGVDVFFVLSGYLITGLLLRERADTGRIRLATFWSRRARRLLPAALLLLVVCAVVTSRIASMTTFSARRGDMLSTLFYYANWHFIAVDQSYFAAFSDASPLRHTWSLAIEEQFYLLWPVLLIGALYVTRGRTRVLPWLIGIGAAVSAVLMAATFTASSPARAYYGTDTRAHALLIGAALATLVHLHPTLLSGTRARAAAMWLAIPATGIVVVAFLALNDKSSFTYRGGAPIFELAVAVCLWAVETRPRQAPAAALSVAPLVWVGRISYGLYLWHWPLIVWINSSRGLADWTPTERNVLAIVATFAVATASFYLVERPVRYGMIPWLRLHGARLAVVMSICASLVVGIVLVTTDLGSSSVAGQVTDRSDSPCPAGSPTVAGLFSWCARTAAATPHSAVVAVIGDSTSRALDPGMRQIAKRRGWEYIQGGQPGCSATPELFVSSAEPQEADVKRTCQTTMPKLMADITATADPDVWIVVDWTTLLLLVRPDGNALASDDPRRAALLVPSMQTMLRRLTANGAQVIYVATPPNGEPVDCVTNDPPDRCGARVFSVRDHPIVVLHHIERAATSSVPGVTYISVTDVLCPDDGRCPAAIDGVLARYDGVHYTATFSRTIAEVIVARAKQAGVSFGGS